MPSYGSPSIEKMEKHRDVGGLIQTLKLRDYDMRMLAARALGNLGDRKAVKPLIGLLQDPEELVRTGAAYAPGKLKDSSAREALT
jgi:HEAT repeat protein